ncbi:MAG: hypothetical protein R3B09_13250 [Nannocystaceae bacterium]
MATEPPASPAVSPQRRLLVGVATVVLLVGFTVGVRWLLAASEGEKCGGATGCKSGLVCVQPSVLVVGDVVENRRCRLRCTTDAECPSPRTCAPIGGKGVHACVGRADFR